MSFRSKTVPEASTPSFAERAATAMGEIFNNGHYRFLVVATLVAVSGPVLARPPQPNRRPAVAAKENLGPITFQVEFSSQYKTAEDAARAALRESGRDPSQYRLTFFTKGKPKPETLFTVRATPEPSQTAALEMPPPPKGRLGESTIYLPSSETKKRMSRAALKGLYGPQADNTDRATSPKSGLGHPETRGRMPDMKGAGDGQESAEGGRGAEAVARYIKARMKAIQVCYEGQAKRNPSLHGRVVVRFTVSGGRITEIDVIDDSMNNETVNKCIIRTMRQWRGFPGDGEFFSPFIFSASSASLSPDQSDLEHDSPNTDRQESAEPARKSLLAQWRRKLNKMLVGALASK